MLPSWLLFCGFSCRSFAYEDLHLYLEGELSSLQAANHRKVDFGESHVEYHEKTVAGRINTRGQHCLKAERKCFGVSLSDELPDLGRHFNLASLSGDHGYINYVLGLKFMEKIGLNGLKHRYVHLHINGQSSGLYLLLDEPKNALITGKKAEFIGRRQHWPKKSKLVYSDPQASINGESYLKTFEMIVKASAKLHGQHKFLYLQQSMDFTSYIDWLATNSLLQNGDYDDELFFYVSKADAAQGHRYFRFMGWDYEDLFSKPHVINRIVHPFQIKKTMLHSLVQKIDYAIYRDSYLYSFFKERLRYLTNTVFNEAAVAAIFAELLDEISPFLHDEVLSSSRHDQAAQGVYTSGYITQLANSRYQQLMERSHYLANSH